MSSVGQAAGGIVGAVAGFLLAPATAGASLTWALYGAQIGMTAGGLIDPPKGPNVQGPRLSDLSVQTSTYGAVIPRLYGTVLVAGNIIWLKGDKLTERKKKKKSGGKGGGGGTTTTTYSYYATFAVGLAIRPAEPVIGIKRLWIGPNLVYDGGATTAAAIVQSGKVKAGWKLYTGTDTQQPDPTIQADKGAANVSGWPGLVYLVFTDLALAKYSNSLAGAQVRAEIVSEGEYGWGRPTADSDIGVQFGASTGTGGVGVGYPYIIKAADGIIHVGTRDGTKTWLFDMSGNLKGTKTLTSPPYVSGVTVGAVNWNCSGQLDDGRYLWVENGSGSTSPKFMIGASPTTPDKVIAPNLPGLKTVRFAMATDNRSFIAFINEPAVGGYKWYEFDMLGTQLDTGVHEFPEEIWPTWSRGGRSSGSGNYRACCYDSIARTYLDVWGAGDGDITLMRLESGALMETIHATTGFPGSGLVGYNFTYPTCFLINEVAIGISKQTMAIIAETISGTTATLSDVVEDECLQSGLLTAGDLDVTGLASDTVRGYRVTGGSIRSNLEPLQNVWPFDLRMHGYKIQAVRRGQASVANIPWEVLDARPVGTEPNSTLTIPRDMDSQIPRLLSFKYLDADREYDINEQIAQRYNTDAKNETTIEVSVVLSAQEAARANEILLYTWWRERGADIPFKLPPSYLHLEPADIVTITARDNSEHILRLTNINYASSNLLDCVARYEHPAGYTSSAVVDTGSSNGNDIVIAGPSLGVLIDLPALTADADTPGFYAAQAGLMDGWPGGVLFASYDSGQEWEDLTAFADASTFGTVAVALGAPLCYDAIDTSGTLTVSLYDGTLASVTDTQLFGGANHFAYGAHGRWEIIGARTATLNGDGTYTLQDFIRGRQGTEQYSGAHQAGDWLVLLDTTLSFVGRLTAHIDLAGLFRHVTIDQDIEEVADEAFTYTGENLMPRSPIYLNGSRHPSTNDWTLTWVPRYRINTEWRDYVDVAEDEASAAFEVEIYSSGAYTTLKRTLTGLTSATATYTSAQQVTDFGSNQATLYVKVYKISAAVGRGHPLTTSITR